MAWPGVPKQSSVAAELRLQPHQAARCSSSHHLAVRALTWVAVVVHVGLKHTSCQTSVKGVSCLLQLAKYRTLHTQVMLVVPWPFICWALSDALMCYAGQSGVLHWCPFPQPGKKWRADCPLLLHCPKLRMWCLWCMGGPAALLHSRDGSVRVQGRPAACIAGNPCMELNLIVCRPSPCCSVVQADGACFCHAMPWCGVKFPPCVR